MSVDIRRGSTRFRDHEPGRETRHSFSFGSHYDPDNVGIGPMVCHDDHRLALGRGFEEHRHADLEIVSWVLGGAVEHRDDVGGGAGQTDGVFHVEPGSVGVLTAGSGVVHAEVAAARQTRFVQAWLTPDDLDLPPAYAVTPVVLPEGELVPVASGHLDSAATSLRCAAATFWVARLPTGASVRLPDDPLQHVYVGRGALTRFSLAEPLSEGDAFVARDAPGLEVTAAVPSELLVWSFTG